MRIAGLMASIVGLGGILPDAAVATPPKQIAAFAERITPSLQVSGHYIAGFMRPSEAQSPDPAAMTVWLDEGHQRLCVSARTIDGYYEAIAEYDISSTESGAHRLDFGAKKEHVFDTYGPEELVLRGQVGSDCTMPDELSEAPMAWGAVTQVPVSYVVFVNADGLDAEIIVPKRDNPRQVVKFPCSEVDTEFKRRVYDERCVITPGPDLDGSKAWIELSRYGTVETWERLSLLLGGY